MAIYKQKNGKSNNWYIDFTSPSGERIRQSAGTENKQQAQELHDRLKADAWRIVQLGDKPKYKWQDAVTRWLTEQAHKKSIVDDKANLRWLHSRLYDIALVDINKSVVDQLKQEKMSDKVSNATVNRMLAVLRSILNRAVKEWEWLDKAPHIRLLPEPAPRVRWLTYDESRRLIAELPEHLADTHIERVCFKI